MRNAADSALAGDRSDSRASDPEVQSGGNSIVAPIHDVPVTNRDASAYGNAALTYGTAASLIDSEASSASHADSGTAPQVDDLPKWKIVGEAFDSYIMVEDGTDLLFIDKHAAHERILFEQLSAEGQQPLSQMLMEPLVLRFDREELDILLSNRALLGDMGFEYEPFGGDSMLVRALPEEIDRADAQASLDEIALSLIENRRAPMTQRREEALRLVACKAAVKAGSPSTPAEKYALVARVMQFADVRYCPHGRPVAAVLKKSELEKRFGRT
jgi:DNA mismatch repair protein MutL